MRISSKGRIKSVKNKSFDNQSIISSDYVFLKNGNIKRKRNKNSYFINNIIICINYIFLIVLKF